MQWLINLSRRNRNRIGLLVTNTCSKSINSECGIHSTRLAVVAAACLPALIDAHNGHGHWHLSYSSGPFSNGVGGKSRKKESLTRQHLPKGGQRGFGGVAWRLLFSFSTMTFQFSYCRVSVLFPFLFTGCLPCASCCCLPAAFPFDFGCLHSLKHTDAHTHTHVFL